MENIKVETEVTIYHSDGKVSSGDWLAFNGKTLGTNKGKKKISDLKAALETKANKVEFVFSNTKFVVPSNKKTRRLRNAVEETSRVPTPVKVKGPDRPKAGTAYSWFNTLNSHRPASRPASTSRGKAMTELSRKSSRASGTHKRGAPKRPSDLVQPVLEVIGSSPGNRSAGQGLRNLKSAGKTESQVHQQPWPQSKPMRHPLRGSSPQSSENSGPEALLGRSAGRAIPNDCNSKRGENSAGIYNRKGQGSISGRPGQGRQSLVNLLDSPRKAPKQYTVHRECLRVEEGFRNLGNTCYMNAVLQGLLSLPAFIDDLQRKCWVHSMLANPLSGKCGMPNLDDEETVQEEEKVTGDALAPPRLYEALLHISLVARGGDHGVMNPARLKRAMDKHSDRFAGNLQQDAHEFLNDLINVLHEEAYPRLPAAAKLLFEGGSGGRKGGTGSEGGGEEGEEGASPGNIELSTPSSSRSRRTSGGLGGGVQAGLLASPGSEGERGFSLSGSSMVDLSMGNNTKGGRRLLCGSSSRGVRGRGGGRRGNKKRVVRGGADIMTPEENIRAGWTTDPGITPMDQELKTAEALGGGVKGLGTRWGGGRSRGVGGIAGLQENGQGCLSGVEEVHVEGGAALGVVSGNGTELAKAVGGGDAGGDKERYLPTSRHFQAEVEVTLTCTSCTYSRRHKELYRDFSLDLPPPAPGGPGGDGSALSLDHLLNGFFHSKELTLQCERCGNNRVHADHSLAGLPGSLILHIKRFKLNNMVGPGAGGRAMEDAAAAEGSGDLRGVSPGGGRGGVIGGDIGSTWFVKLTDPVSVPRELDLQRFCTKFTANPPVDDLGERVCSVSGLDLGINKEREETGPNPGHEKLRHSKEGALGGRRSAAVDPSLSVDLSFENEGEKERKREREPGTGAGNFPVLALSSVFSSSSGGESTRGSAQEAPESSGPLQAGGRPRAVLRDISTAIQRSDPDAHGERTRRLRTGGIPLATPACGLWTPVDQSSMVREKKRRLEKSPEDRWLAQDSSEKRAFHGSRGTGLFRSVPTSRNKDSRSGVNGKAGGWVGNIEGGISGMGGEGPADYLGALRGYATGQGGGQAAWGSSSSSSSSGSRWEGRSQGRSDEEERMQLEEAMLTSRRGAAAPSSRPPESDLERAIRVSAEEAGYCDSRQTTQGGSDSSGFFSGGGGSTVSGGLTGSGFAGGSDGEKDMAEALRLSMLDHTAESSTPWPSDPNGGMASDDKELESDWACPQCTLHNKALTRACLACGQGRPTRPSLLVEPAPTMTTSLSPTASTCDPAAAASDSCFLSSGGSLAVPLEGKFRPPPPPTGGKGGAVIVGGGAEEGRATSHIDGPENVSVPKAIAEGEMAGLTASASESGLLNLALGERKKREQEGDKAASKGPDDHRRGDDDAPGQGRVSREGPLRARYRLQGVLHHLGPHAFAGHYVTDVWESGSNEDGDDGGSGGAGTWKRHDDSAVVSVGESKALEGEARRSCYICFYALAG